MAFPSPYKHLLKHIRASPPRAITWNYDIYFNTGQFDETTFGGLALIAQEIMHVLQYQALGTKEFLKEYGTTYDNALEHEASVFEEAFKDWFRNKGKKPCPRAWAEP
jgi:hypothetical protein